MIVGGLQHYRLVDWATQIYLGLVGLLALLFHNPTVPWWGALTGVHFGGMVLVHLLIQATVRRPDMKVLGFFRAFYPMMLFTGFYRETEYLNRIFVSGYLDVWFIQWEHRLFGIQPSVRFMEWLPYRWAAELFYGAYFSYYLMIVGVGLALFFRDRRQFAHYLTVVSILFYLCYLTYIILPVCGPRVFFEDFPGLGIPDWVRAVGGDHPMPAAVAGGVFPSIILLIYRHLEAAGAAFPSSHVAVAVCTTWFSILYLPRIRVLHVIMTVLLCLSTVYCRYHYVVDVVAGVAMALVCVPLLNRLHWRLEGEARPAPAAPPAGEPAT